MLDRWILFDFIVFRRNKHIDVHVDENSLDVRIRGTVHRKRCAFWAPAPVTKSARALRSATTRAIEATHVARKPRECENAWRRDGAVAATALRHRSSRRRRGPRPRRAGTAAPRSPQRPKSRRLPRDPVAATIPGRLRRAVH